MGTAAAAPAPTGSGGRPGNDQPAGKKNRVALKLYATPLFVTVRAAVHPSAGTPRIGLARPTYACGAPPRSLASACGNEPARTRANGELASGSGPRCAAVERTHVPATGSTSHCCTAPAS